MTELMSEMMMKRIFKRGRVKVKVTNRHLGLMLGFWSELSLMTSSTQRWVDEAHLTCSWPEPDKAVRSDLLCVPAALLSSALRRDSRRKQVQVAFQVQLDTRRCFLAAEQVSLDGFMKRRGCESYAVTLIFFRLYYIMK